MKIYHITYAQTHSVNMHAPLYNGARGINFDLCEGERRWQVYAFVQAGQCFVAP